MESLHRRYKGKPFVVIAVDIQEKNETVLRAVQNEGVTYTNLLDKTGEVSELYGVQSTPVKFLIDTNGNMVGAALGYRDWDSDNIKTLIETLMKPGK